METEVLGLLLTALELDWPFCRDLLGSETWSTIFSQLAPHRKSGGKAPARQGVAEAGEFKTIHGGPWALQSCKRRMARSALK